MAGSLKKLVPTKLKTQFKLLFNIDKYLCPFCELSFSKLDWIGIDVPVLKEKHVIGGGMREGGCPNCCSFDRERLVYVYLKEKLRIFAGDKTKSILHIAPETRLSKKMLEHG